ncbi:MAG: ATP-binding protein [Proteobacteria bacterium]|nr:ATP-binding protein [Pseudomonadota bacterium]
MPDGLGVVPEEPPTLILVPLVLNGRPVESGDGTETALPLPADWRGPRRVRGVSKSTGRGVVAVRTPRLVGREPERDLMWSELRGTIQSGSPRALVLRGPSGIGKSRLAWWLCTRSHELGACTVVVARNGPDGGADTGLDGMIARSIHGLGPAALRARVDAELGELSEDDREALVGMARPGLALRIDTGRWRRAVLLRWLRVLARRRPVILWLDDAHWSLDGLHLVHAVLAEADVPVLAVLTIQDEGLGQAPQARPLMEEITGERLALGPLSTAESWELVSDLVGLSPSLAGQVTERCGGNPMLAIELVADQVARDRLVVADTGLELRAGEVLELPADLRALWSDRLDTELAGREAFALELAAVLGSEVRWAVLVEARGPDRTRGREGSGSSVRGARPSGSAEARLVDGATLA